jgi:hypothetical protein
MQPIGFTQSLLSRQSPEWVVMALGSAPSLGGTGSATRQQVFEILEESGWIPIAATDPQPYDDDAAKGVDMPRWQRFIEIAIAHQLAAPGLIFPSHQRVLEDKVAGELREMYPDDPRVIIGVDSNVLELTALGWQEYRDVSRRWSLTRFGRLVSDRWVTS